MQADEGDAVLPDQHPRPSYWSVSAVVVTTQFRRPCLWMVSVDTGKDCCIITSPVGIDVLIGQTDFHQDDREIQFLKIQPPKWGRYVCTTGLSPSLALA